jgi:hypothetical protein
MESWETERKVPYGLVGLVGAKEDVGVLADDVALVVGQGRTLEGRARLRIGDLRGTPKDN